MTSQHTVLERLLGDFCCHWSLCLVVSSIPPNTGAGFDAILILCENAAQTAERSDTENSCPHRRNRESCTKRLGKATLAFRVTI